MKSKLKMAAVLMIFSLFAAVYTPLIAAQGQITEVNPSGVHGTIIVVQADDGEEVVKGDVISFVNPRAFQKGYVPIVDDEIEFDAVKNGKHLIAVNIRRLTQNLDAGIASKPATSGSTSWGAIKESMKSHIR